MRRELTEDEVQSVYAILKELCGYTVEQAEVILKRVASTLKEFAVIEEGNNNG